MPLAVEVVAVAGEAVPVVDLLPIRGVGGERLGVLAQRIVEPRQGDRLPAERDVRRRRRVDGAQVRRRAHRGAHLPERMLGVAPQPGRQGHLWAARYWTSASSCAAFIIVPKVLGMIPASFS